MNTMIDVVLTTHNDSEFLREAVLSVIFGASSAEFIGKIVIVDDASTQTHAEHVRKICAELSAFHKDILLTRNSANCGLSHSRNLGLKFCSAPYVTFLDADDLKPAGWGATVRELIEKYNPDYLFTASSLINDQYLSDHFYDFDYFRRMFKQDQEKIFDRSGRFLPLILEPQIGNKYFKKSVIEKYLFPIGRKYEDLFLLSRMVLDLDLVVGANYVTHLYNTTERSSRITMSPKLKDDIIGNLIGVLAVYDRHFDKQIDEISADLQSAGKLIREELEHKLRVLDLERQLAYAVLKCGFTRMIEWSINTIGANDVDAFIDRAGRAFRLMSPNPSTASLLGELANKSTLERFDRIVDALVIGDANYFRQDYA